MSLEPLSLPVPALSEREGAPVTATIHAPGTLEEYAVVEYVADGDPWREESDDALVAWEVAGRLRLVGEALRAAKE
jgi:hypothetical protein